MKVGWRRVRKDGGLRLDGAVYAPKELGEFAGTMVYVSDRYDDNGNLIGFLVSVSNMGGATIVSLDRAEKSK